jgi:hypothetical protein
VWGLPARDADGTSYTCGARIEYLQTAPGGGLGLHDAKFRVGLHYHECDACWPWPKLKAQVGQGPELRSHKRGIAIQNHKLSSQALANLRGSASWGYVWDFNPSNTWPTGGPTLQEWQDSGVRFVPMVWGESQMETTDAAPMAQGMQALLGFNEPNFPSQANMDPVAAAQLWPQVEALAAAHGIDTIVSPALNFGPADPIWWLQTFLAACVGCKVDAIALHSYTCYGRYLKDHLDLYRPFGKPLWLTEFACSDASTPERLDASGQMAYMREAVPLLEQDPDVAYYAWFSYFGDEWEEAIREGTNGDAGLVNPDGSLSELGALYGSFATTLPEQVPA